LTATSGQDSGNPLIVIGDQIQPKLHLVSLLQHLRNANNYLSETERIQYVVCSDSADVALALRKHLDAVRMILIGPNLEGNTLAMARMLSQKAFIVMVIDPQINPLGNTPKSIQQNHNNLQNLGIIVTMNQQATREFFEPIVQDCVLSDILPGTDLESMSAEERAQMVDQRLDSVNKFPSLPETQRKVAELDDMDSPLKWAEAIDPDVPTRTVILRLLNSARYGFRTRIERIDQAVALASAKTIREIVTACQIRQIFDKTAEKTIDQFWRHSLATAFYAKLFSLSADPATQTPRQKAEFERYQFEQDDIEQIQTIRLWEALGLDDEGDFFTAGLLHDVGKITMAMCLEDSLELIKTLIDSEFQDAQQADEIWAQSVIEIERFLMKDMDHQVIGSRLAEKWDMDPIIGQTIGHHHNIHEKSLPILKLIALADLAANCLFPYPIAEEQHPLPQLFTRIEKSLRDKPGMNTDQALDEIINQEIFEDLVSILSGLGTSESLWELIDFKTFFKLAYLTAPKIKNVSIAFLQQTS